MCVGHGETFSPFTTIQTISSYNPTLVLARKLILSMYIHLIIMHKNVGVSSRLNDFKNSQKILS